MLDNFQAEQGYDAENHFAFVEGESQCTSLQNININFCLLMEVVTNQYYSWTLHVCYLTPNRPIKSFFEHSDI